MDADSIMTSRQRRLVGYGMASAGILVVGILLAVMITLLVFVLRRVESAVAPLVIGLFLSFSLRPVFDRVRRFFMRLGLKSARWVNAITVTVFLLPLGTTVVALFWWLGCYGVNQISSFCATLPGLWNRLLESFPKLASLINSAGVAPESFLKDQLPQFVLSHMGQLASLKNLVSTWLFALFFSICFLVRPLKTGRIVDEFKALPILSGENWDFLGKQLHAFEGIMSVYLPKQIGINIFEGIVGAIGLWFLDIPYGGILGFLMGFLNIIPVYGTVAMLPVVLLISLFGDGGCWMKFWFSLVIWAVVESADLILPNKVHGDDMNLSPAVIVFSFLFWSALISPIWGMILAIPLSAFSISLWESVKELVKRNYYKENNNVEERRS